MYTTKRFEATIPVDEYLEKYVDVDTFLKCCKACPHYNGKWSCPSYDFDVIEYWKKYNSLELTAVKIIFDEDYAGKEFPEDEILRITESSVKNQTGTVQGAAFTGTGNPRQRQPVRRLLHSVPGECARKENKPCRYPDKMRYSLESLGGNVGMTISKLMGVELEWMEEGKLPHHFVLVCGLLRK